MSIDRIGRRETLRATTTSGAERIARTGRAFKIAGPTSTEGAASAQATSALERLRAGELDTNGYLDEMARDATSGLRGLAPSRLALIEDVLREQLATDLADLVKEETSQDARERSARRR